MLVIMIITSTQHPQGLSQESPLLKAFTKHRPCVQSEQVDNNLFNALKNKCFKQEIDRKMRQ